jgi:hypothetical protein
VSRLAPIAAVLLVASCASGPRDTPAAGDAPIPAGKTRLYVYRAPGSAGPRDAGGVTLDSRPLVSLGRGEYVSVVLEPGAHVLKSGVSDQSRFASLPPKALELRADRATYCSLAAQVEGGLVVWDLYCSADSEAHTELRTCRLGKLDRTVDWQP